MKNPFSEMLGATAKNLGTASKYNKIIKENIITSLRKNNLNLG